jgi:DNA-binding transcriptional MerR regulator
MPPMADPAPDELTIDELARVSGMIVRNIRSHATRGVLMPPCVRARTGYNGPEHVARLQLIHDLQGNGYNLAAIKHLMTQTDKGSAEEVLGSARALLAPWESERPEVVDEAELTARFGPVDEKLSAGRSSWASWCRWGRGATRCPRPCC